MASPRSRSTTQARYSGPNIINGTDAMGMVTSNVVRLRPKQSPKTHPPRRVANAEVRSREYLTQAEVGSLLKVASKRGRYGQRDATLILLSFRHGLRVSEAVALKWDQVDLGAGLLHVTRLKGGTSSTHPMRGDELRALRQLQREWPDSGGFVFVTERGGPMTAAGVRKLIARIGKKAGLPFPVHPHMLRHAAGYALASEGQNTRDLQHWLGHKNIQHTVRYTELAPGRFRSFWKNAT